MAAFFPAVKPWLTVQSDASHFTEFLTENSCLLDNC